MSVVKFSVALDTVLNDIALQIVEDEKHTKNINRNWMINQALREYLDNHYNIDWKEFYNE